MDKGLIEEMKVKLEEMKRSILQTLATEDEEFSTLVKSDEVKDLADLASSDIDTKTLEILGRQEIKRLHLIESALGRIANGNYGRCLKSGKKIPLERLKAIPYALYTVEVQEELDKIKRRRA